MLPDDVIKYIESFVDKRPPFADELLNRNFVTYEWNVYEDDSDFFHQDNFNVKYDNMDNYTLNKYVHVLSYEREHVCDIRFTETLYGYEWDGYDRGMVMRHSALGLILHKDADQQGIPRQTFDCGIN